MVYMIFAGLLVLNSFLNAVVDIYHTYEVASRKPIKGYVQVVKIIIAVFIGIIAISIKVHKLEFPGLIISYSRYM